MTTSSSIFADETPHHGTVAQASSPNDASRALTALLSLAESAATRTEPPHPDDILQQVIARPVLRMLLSALRVRHASTMQHSRRVAALAVGLAENLGWEHADQKVLEVACLLHDVGKIGIPDHILFKPGRLNAEESRQMALHGNIGVAVLQACGADLRVIEFIDQAIAFSDKACTVGASDVGKLRQGARILMVADAYDSLRSDQVFREGRSHGDVLEILMKESGTRFDGNVVCTLARWIERDGLPASLLEEADDTVAGLAADSREAEQARTLTQTLQQLYHLEQQCDGFYVLDPGLNFIVWSRGAQRLLKQPARNILGRPWSADLLAYAGELSQPLSSQETPLRRALQTAQAQSMSLRVKQSSEVWVDVEVQALPLLQHSGRLQGAAELLVDIHQTRNLPPDYLELKFAASRDPLTSVANRGELDHQLHLLFEDWNDSPEAEPFCVIFLDVDFFKNINDTFGHTTGDQVLIDVTRLLRRESCAGELLGRYGGEEFVILCPATTLDQAVRRAERLREAVQRNTFSSLGNYRVTASFGITQVERSDTPEQLLSRADKALYQAKETGRNKTCSLTSEQERSLEGDETPQTKTRDDPFLFRTTFEACLGADMIVYKLGGLVRDERAKLGDVAENRVEIRFGSAGLFRFWGNAPHRRPVSVIIEFDSLREPSTGQYRAAPMAEVRVTIRPMGIVRNPEVFQKRARNVLKLLRSYLQAAG